jgi:hypothetical protein
LPEHVAYPKERALVELALRERTRNRRLLVYITHTERRDISPRLRVVLERAGLRVAVLKADTVAADRREDWIAAQVRDGTEVLICHPRLVQTGLDLVDWPSICWFETEYSVYVMRQASRRSWRIGQRQPVEVTYLAYEGTLQAEALALVASKMRSSLMIEGELPDDGLAALEGNDQDVMLDLARRLTDQRAGDASSLEALFAQRREAEAEDAAYLVGGGWEGVACAPQTHGGDGDGADPSTCALSQRPSTAGDTATVAFSGAATRLVSFDELVKLVRRPKSRRKSIPAGQLKLFSD